VQSSVHDFSAQPSLEQADPEIYDLLQHEQTRQFKGLELIASEVRAQTHAPAHAHASMDRHTSTAPTICNSATWQIDER
jgi:glycine/serine hydroxymethyltransferase